MDIYQARRANLARLIAARFKGNETAFAKHMGLKAPQISRWLSDTAKDRRRISEESARRIEAGCSLTQGWLDAADLTEGELPTDIALSQIRLLAGPKGRDAVARLVTGDISPGNRGVGHRMNLISARVTPQTTAWEALSVEPLPPVFWLEINDDAMQPDLVRGDFAELDTSLAADAMPGDIVLVRTGTGEFFIREYRASRAGAAWTAAAINRAYDPLDHERDELTVIAVLTNEWRSGRRSRRL